MLTLMNPAKSVSTRIWIHRIIDEQQDSVDCYAILKGDILAFGRNWREFGDVEEFAANIIVAETIFEDCIPDNIPEQYQAEFIKTERKERPATPVHWANSLDENGQDNDNDDDNKDEPQNHSSDDDGDDVNPNDESDDNDENNEEEGLEETEPDVKEEAADTEQAEDEEQTEVDEEDVPEGNQASKKPENKDEGDIDFDDNDMAEQEYNSYDDYTENY